MYSLILCLLSLSAVQAASEGEIWAYTGNNGESHWPLKYKFCGSVYQSPLDFHNNILQYDTSLQPIQLYGYDASSSDSFILSNNGHTVSMSLLPNMYMEIPPFRYIASQLHLHWGSTTSPKGSEHCIGGKRFAAELHIVHYNTKYTDLATAMGVGDGLAVLGILIEIGSFNPAFDNIISQLANVKYKGQTATIPWFNVQDLIPERLDEYYRYQGSLTTPPCNPCVLWSVFRNQVYISEEQLTTLESTLYCNEGNTSSSIQMTDNYRQLQPEGDRLVSVSFREGIVLSVVLASILASLLLISVSCWLIHRKKSADDYLLTANVVGPDLHTELQGINKCTCSDHDNYAPMGKRGKAPKNVLYTAAASKEEDTTKALSTPEALLGEESLV
ncbi:carbonic anhydrase 12 [Gastrophryne carolinensis]